MHSVMYVYIYDIYIYVYIYICIYMICICIYIYGYKSKIYHVSVTRCFAAMGLVGYERDLDHNQNQPCRCYNLFGSHMDWY